MARAKSPNPRNVMVAVRLTQDEARRVDFARGALTRAEWLRWLLLQWRKGQET